MAPSSLSCRRTIAIWCVLSSKKAAAPSTCTRVGNRWLEEEEFAHLYRWLGSTACQFTPAYSVALRVHMLTGQRVQEIAALRSAQWISAEKLLEWGKTKNGRPHAIPVCELAARV